MNDAIRKTLADIAGFLRDHDAPFVLIGGIAVSVRGEPRFTADVDLVVGIELDRALELLDAVADSSFRPLFADTAEVVRTSYILPLRHRQTRVKVDLAIGLTGFERQMIGRAEDTCFGEFELPVATAEDLILMKTLASRPRDTDDVVRIVSRQGENIDWDYLLSVGAELGEAVGQDIVSQLREHRSESAAED